MSQATLDPPAVTINQKRSFWREFVDAYSDVWKARTFIDYYLKCKNSSSYGMTALKNAWYIAEPISNMLIYYFLVAIIFQRGAMNGIHPFVFIMLGLVHYLALRQITSKGMLTVITMRGLLLQMKAEPLIYFAVNLYDNLWKFVITMGMFALFYVWLGPPMTWQLAFYPLIFFVFVLICWSTSILIGTLVVFCRDLQYFYPIGVRLMMYAAPVIYLTSFVPDNLRYYYLFNPIACLFALMQWSVLGLDNSQLPQWPHILSLGLFVTVLFISVHWIYFRLRIYFTKAF